MPLSRVPSLIGLSNLKINIITNSQKFFDFFAHDSNRKIILLGGELLHGGMSSPFSQEADHVKFGRICLYKVDFNLDEIDTIITDQFTDKKYIDEFQNLGIEVLVSKQLS